MEKMNSDIKQGKSVQKTIDGLVGRKKASIWIFVLLLVLYIVSSVIVNSISSSKGVLILGQTRMPLSAFTGVLSSVSNICLIFMALYFGKLGFFTSLGLSLLQFPFIFNSIFLHHNVSTLPGIFANILAIITILIIYINKKMLDGYQDKIRDQAITDRLTRLPNRFACSELVEEYIKKGEKFAIVSADINGFKSINNTMGYEAGNQVLIEISKRWKALADSGVTGTQDFISRTGGDEYDFVIKGFRTEDDLLKAIKHYEAALNNRLTIDDCDLFITASFGYAMFPADAKTSDALFSYADTALHEVKRANSSDHILHFTSDLVKMERVLEIEAKIRHAIENDTLYFNLQPQYDMGHRLRGFETLARMKDDEGNFISPGEFIPVAEKVGLIDKVDSTVFRKSAVFFGELINKTNADLILCINVSVRHLMKNDFIDEIKDILNVSGLKPNKLEIEITESIMIDSADKALKCINELRGLGIQLAIDDFGTGYSSLSYLNTFPANILKIDKSFIDKMNTSESSRQYVAAIISIGHIMGFDVISEGVEKEDQLATLRENGCDYIQGYIWGRPLPKEEAERLVLESVA